MTFAPFFRIEAIFPSPDPSAKLDRRWLKLVKYAKEVEKDLYKIANSRLEYYHLLADKIIWIQVELETKREQRRIQLLNPTELKQYELDRISAQHNQLLKLESDEALGDQAPMGAILYSNKNHPTLKIEYPNWPDRFKQILKIWRNLPNDERLPYDQQARKNCQQSQQDREDSSVRVVVPVSIEDLELLFQ